MSFDVNTYLRQNPFPLMRKGWCFRILLPLLWCLLIACMATATIVEKVEGKDGAAHLRVGVPVNRYLSDDNTVVGLPYDMPLLFIHVALVITAYSLLAIITLMALYCLLLSFSSKDITSLTAFSQLLLYPAVSTLTLGIFVGQTSRGEHTGRGTQRRRGRSSH